MKGIVFTEFMDMVESRFGPDVLDDVIDASSLPNAGAYTAVGTYDHREILRMVGCLGRITSLDASALVKAFGEYLVARFAIIYPHFFVGNSSLFEFLPMVEDHIHREVKKLYPDAGLPTLRCQRLSPDELIIEYRSQRPFADLAEGMIAGSARHFGERLNIERVDLGTESGFATRFRADPAYLNGPDDRTTGAAPRSGEACAPGGRGVIGGKEFRTL
jgi:hypothetical protein